MGKGKYRIVVSTGTNPDVELPFHYNYLTNAVECAKLYKKTPHVFKITVSDDFYETLWIWTPEEGEKEMSRFATAVRESRGNFVTSTMK